MSKKKNKKASSGPGRAVSPRQRQALRRLLQGQQPLQKKMPKKGLPDMKKGGKRFKLNIGDIVYFTSNNQHWTGTIGPVVAVLDKNFVVVHCIAPGDSDLPQQFIVVLTYPPDDTVNYNEYWQHVTKRVLRAQPKAPKPPKEKTLVTLEGQEQVLAALAGDVTVDKNTVVAITPAAIEEPTVVVPIIDQRVADQQVRLLDEADIQAP